LAHTDPEISLGLAKEFFQLVEHFSSLPREPLAVLASNISVRLFSSGYTREAVVWNAKAIAKDDRRLTFYLNKAIMLASLRELKAVVSLVGHVRSSKQRFLDFSDDVFLQLNELSKNALNSLQLEGSPFGKERPLTDLGAKAEKIYLFACCYNEATILPFFLDYYKNYVGVSRFFVFDGGSDDGSLEILERYGATIILEKHDTLNDLVLMNFRNNFYKQYRDECDWVIVCDLDEFIYHPNLKDRLAQMTGEGVTIPKIAGYSMISLDVPEFEEGNFLPYLCTKGEPDPHSANKNLIFKPNVDINYSMGCHSCAPQGDVVFSAEYELKNLHYMSLSYAQVIQKSERQHRRLSDWNKNAKAGAHYEHRAKTRLSDYLAAWENATEVIELKNQGVTK
jgi:hypothetical protein